MKVTWDAEDINPGRRYRKNIDSEEWIIGYLSGSASGSSRYVSISTRDGLVTDPQTKEQLAQLLTENNYLPVELL